MISSKQLGIILLVVGLMVVALTFASKAKEDFYIDTLVNAAGGQCVLESGYCLHQDRNWTGYVIGWVLGAALVILGGYLLLFEKSYEAFTKEQEKFVKEVAEAKQKDEFAAYLAGFTPEEQNILKAVHEQDGIKQSTLRYRTGMSKAMLSIILNSLEKRDVVARKAAGKTKEVYLRKKF